MTDKQAHSLAIVMDWMLQYIEKHDNTTSIELKREFGGFVNDDSIEVMLATLEAGHVLRRTTVQTYVYSLTKPKSKGGRK